MALHESQIQQDAFRPTRPLMDPKYTMKFANWGVQKVTKSGNIAQAAREMKRNQRKKERGISESHWTRQKSARKRNQY